MGANDEPPPGDSSNGRISQAVLDCLDSFRRFMSMRDESAAQTVLPTIRDEETRFKVWSGNIGAHKQGRSSLDYRLRDASHLQTQALSLLAELTTLLEDVIAIVQGDKIPWEMLDEDPLREGEEEEETGIPETELAQIATDVVEVVNCLLRLSVSIRNPAPHDRLKSSTGNKTRHYEVFDIQHVRSKFGSVNDVIARRLGKAISKRREYFRYRETHHAKLSHGLELDHHHQEVGSTVASSIPQQMKDPGVAAGSNRIPVVDEDAASVMNMSETSFASSTGANDTLRIPPLPDEAHRGPFECPFCYTMIAATNTKSWRRHVYADLRPYLCVSEDCQTPEHQFDRRRDWMQHELQNHWKTYTCPFGCPDNSKYPSAAALKGHLNNKHKSNMSASQLGALIDLSARPLQIEDGIDCRLCGESLFSIQTYGRHVGRHQEQISLFSLPSVAYADGDETTDGEDTAGSTGNDDEVDGSGLVDDAVEPDASVASLTRTDPPPVQPVDGKDLSQPKPRSEEPGGKGHGKTADNHGDQPHLGPDNDALSKIVSKAYGPGGDPDKTSGPQGPGEQQLESRSPKNITLQLGSRPPKNTTQHPPQQKSQPTVATSSKSYPLPPDPFEFQYTTPGDLARDDIFHGRTGSKNTTLQRQGSMDSTRHQEPNSRPSAPTGRTRPGTVELENMDVNITIQGGDTVVQAGGKTMRFPNGTQINFGQAPEGRTAAALLALAQSGGHPHPPGGHPPGGHHPNPVQTSQPTYGRPQITPIIKQAQPNRRREVAHVEDVDDDGNVIDGRSRYARVRDRETRKTGGTMRAPTLEERLQPGPSAKAKEDDKALKGILKPPTSRFPKTKDENPTREGVPSRKDDKTKQGTTPSAAKWTKISQRMVSPLALTIANERFEVRDDFVIVLRVLSKEEIQAYAEATARLRDVNRAAYENTSGRVNTTRPVETTQVSHDTPEAGNYYPYPLPPRSRPPPYPPYPSVFPQSLASVQEDHDIRPRVSSSPDAAVRRRRSMPLANLAAGRETPAVIQPAPPRTQDIQLPQHKLSRHPSVLGSESGAPGNKNNAEASYYGVAPSTITPASSRPRPQTSRPQSFYNNSRPPPANPRLYQNQAIPQLQQEPPVASYPLPSLSGGAQHPIPAPSPSATQSAADYFSWALESRLGNTAAARPQSSIGFRPPVRPIPFDDYEEPEQRRPNETQPRYGVQRVTIPPPPRPTSAQSSRAIRPPPAPPTRRTVYDDDYYDDYFAEDADLFQDVSPRQPRYDQMPPPPRPAPSRPITLAIRPPTRPEPPFRDPAGQFHYEEDLAREQNLTQQQQQPRYNQRPATSRPPSLLRPPYKTPERIIYYDDHPADEQDIPPQQPRHDQRPATARPPSLRPPSGKAKGDKGGGGRSPTRYLDDKGE